MNQEEVWDEIAGKWDEFRVKVPPTVERFLLGKRGKILDVGCGSGRNVLGKGLEIRDKKLEFYGVDFSSKMVKLAKEKGYVEVLKGDVCALPYGDESFDYVLFYAVLHCVDSVEARRKSLEEVYRVLKKGGEALISAWGSKSPRLKGKGKESYVPWTVRDEGEKILRYTYVYDLIELRREVEEVGFEILECWEERNVNLVVRRSEEYI